MAKNNKNSGYCGFLGAITRSENAISEKERQEDRDWRQQYIDAISQSCKTVVNNCSSENNKNTKPIVIENLTINVFIGENKDN